LSVFDRDGKDIRNKTFIEEYKNPLSTSDYHPSPTQNLEKKVPFTRSLTNPNTKSIAILISIYFFLSPSVFIQLIGDDESSDSEEDKIKFNQIIEYLKF
jgi:hypothetical protein